MMNSDDNKRSQRYRILRDLVLSQTATQAERQELEQLVIGNAERTRDFAEFLHQESALAHLAAERQSHPKVAPAASTIANTGLAWNLHGGSNRTLRIHRAILAATLLLVCTAAISIYARKSSTRAVATMGVNQNCQWAASDSPTVPGAPLSPGRLVLISGIAEINFPQVTIKLEGPADLELISSKRCLVRSGRLYAEVQPGGEGFIVETPTSILTDRGTRFGVNVQPGGDSELTVMQGLVDARHIRSGTTEAVRTNSKIKITDSMMVRDGTTNRGMLGEDGFGDASREDQTTPRPKSIQISTAVGRGRDAYVIAGHERSYSHTSGILLAKKPDPNDPEMKLWRRRTYLHFDLSLLSQETPVDTLGLAKLQLQGVATGVGYLAITPDTHFAVYGLVDESLEDWSEESITWDNSPGVTDDGDEVDPATMVLLGKFLVPNDQATRVFSIQGEQLLEFLRQDTTGEVTMMIVSETIGYGESYVHGFASKHHPELPPPTLRLGIVENQTGKD